jgi:hypothetical protein
VCVVVDRRWLDADTVDYSDLPQVVPPKGRAGMIPARRLPADQRTPPNMPVWPTNPRRRNERADTTLDPTGGESGPS